MTSPREQAIEEAAKAIHSSAFVRCNCNCSACKHEHDRAQDAARKSARAAITAYESARARIDGAKMMPREATDWQPIETAPHRQWVLVYVPWINAVRMAQLKIWRGEPRWFVCFGPSTNRSMYVSGRPTHWQPLPAPPELS